MKNICLILEYKGTNYCGFQRQKNGLSIQEVLENVLEKLLNERIKTYPSGRTDAGVYAYGQVVNFFTNSKITAEKFRVILNLKLPKDIRVLKSFEVDETFNSRKSAKSKTYVYKLFIGDFLSVFDEGRCLLCKYDLDLEKVKKACQKFVGEHDFSSFVSSNSTTKTTVRKIYDLSFEKQGRYLTFSITGNGFLYNMVRIIIGTLIDVGRGKIEVEDIDLLLLGKHREMAGKTVSPDGLYLKEVNY